VEVVSAVGADKEAASVVEPGEGALDHPAVAAQPGAVVGVAASDQRFDAALPEETAVLVVVVAAVGDQCPGLCGVRLLRALPERGLDHVVTHWQDDRERDVWMGVCACEARTPVECVEVFNCES
jgi:hypothetical protein